MILQFDYAAKYLLSAEDGNAILNIFAKGHNLNRNNVINNTIEQIDVILVKPISEQQAADIFAISQLIQQS